MSVYSSEGEFVFLDKPSDETADEFLKRRLSHLESHFSYEYLSALSEERLEEEIQYYNDHIKEIRSHFMDEDSVYVENPELYESIVGESLDLYEPMTQPQLRQYRETTTKVKSNFDKAYQDWKDRRINRITTIFNSVPLLRRLSSKR